MNRTLRLSDEQAVKILIALALHQQQSPGTCGSLYKHEAAKVGDVHAVVAYRLNHRSVVGRNVSSTFTPVFFCRYSKKSWLSRMIFPGSVVGIMLRRTVARDSLSVREHPAESIRKAATIEYATTHFRRIARLFVTLIACTQRFSSPFD